MEIRGLATVEKSVDSLDVFEAFKLMNEINSLKSKLEKVLKGNKSRLGIKTIVEDSFKTNQLVVVGPDFSIERSLIKREAHQVSACEYYTYKIKG